MKFTQLLKPREEGRPSYSSSSTTNTSSRSSSMSPPPPPRLQQPDLELSLPPAAAQSTTTPPRATSPQDESKDVEGDFVRSRVALENENKKLQVMMESVIPKHLVSRMREDLMKPSSTQTSNFQKFYLDYYESVSILFADIVGFTKISSLIPSANELVTMLNELFGRFDKAADANKCLRIKILGDCYYCVSGVPENKDRPEPHAKQCVEMGLDMIDILAELALDWRAPSESGGAGGGGQDGDKTDEKRLKMRIGIHTGQVLCGIMGKKRWQFDVHSNDVKLANHMEQSGVPGRVHISEATLRHLGEDYRVEPAHGRERDSFIAERDIETYFVHTPSERRKDSTPVANLGSAAPARVPAGSRGPADSTPASPVESEPTIQGTISHRVPREAKAAAAASAAMEPRALAQQVVAGVATVVDQAGRTTLLAAPKADVRLTITEVATPAGSAASEPGHTRSPLSGQQQQQQRANQVAPATTTTTTTTTARTETDSGSRELPVVQAASTIVAINQNNETVSLLARDCGEHGQRRHANNGLTMAGSPWGTISTGANNNNNINITSNNINSANTHLASQLQVNSSTAARPMKSKSQQNMIQMSNLVTSLTAQDMTETVSGGAAGSTALVGKNRFKRTTRALINAKHFIRTIDAPFANLDSDQSDLVNIDKIICDTKAGRGQIKDVHKWTLRFKDPELGQLYHQKRRNHREYCQMLYQKFKQQMILSLLVFVITLSILVFVTIGHPSAGQDSAAPFGLLSESHQTISIALMISICLSIVAFLIYRLHQAELNSRIDFVLRQKAVKDKARMEQMRQWNRYIFFNILPQHVAEYFLSSKGPHRDLYSRSYDTVGVSFATVCGFTEFYEEKEVNDHGKGCLNLLNEILCDFDELLDLDQFRSIDKIKTIGDTYMTACGLCHMSSDNSGSSRALALQLRTMLEFLMAMRECLEDISSNAFNTYKLRAGLNYGPVTAGVIGATKPQYDIWGNTVNVASRMESTCEPNKIQVTEDVYMLLKCFFNDIKFTCRGSIDIKGKGEMTTYYVEMPPNKYRDGS